MTLVEFLASDEARAALDELEAEPIDDLVRLVSVMRARFDRERAAALVDLHRMRAPARLKFGARASSMLYTAASLEQATPLSVALHRARRFPVGELIADLGCGIGGDAIALPGVVVGVDIDHLRLAMARHNVGADRFHPVRADLTTFPAIRVAAAFADPARRDASGRRVFNVERYNPPLSVIVGRWRPSVPSMCVKVHPGIDHADIPSGAEAEFVSLEGDMRECSLWFGDLRTAAATRATLLPAGVSITGRPSATGLIPGPVGRRLHEPDSAVIRAGLVGDLAEMLGLNGIDVAIAYLTGDEDITSPFVTSYEVETVMPFNTKKIKAHLRSLGVGTVVVKKRGSAVEPDAFRRSLGLSGPGSRTVFLTRHHNKPVAIICLSLPASIANAPLPPGGGLPPPGGETEGGG